LIQQGAREGKGSRSARTLFRHLHYEKLLAFFWFGNVRGNKRVLGMECKTLADRVKGEKEGRISKE
jgi:hypothetical protein